MPQNTVLSNATDAAIVKNGATQITAPVTPFAHEAPVAGQNAS